MVSEDIAAHNQVLLSNRRKKNQLNFELRSVSIRTVWQLEGSVYIFHVADDSPPILTCNHSFGMTLHPNRPPLVRPSPPPLNPPVHQPHLTPTGVGKSVAAAVGVTTLASASVPDEAAAFGPIKMELTEPEYAPVVCPPKTQVSLFDAMGQSVPTFLPRLEDPSDANFGWCSKHEIGGTCFH